MVRQANKTLIGGFVLGAAGLVVIALLVFGSGRFFTDKQRFVLYFEGAVNGLSVGAPVDFRGVTIGSVTEINLRFHPKELSIQIPVYIEIVPKMIQTAGESGYAPVKTAALLVDRGMRAQLRLASLITSKLMVQLDFYPDTQAVMKGDGSVPEIPTISSNLEEFTRTLSKFPLKEAQDHIMSILRHTDELVQSPRLEHSVDEFNGAVKDVRELARHLDRRTDRLTGLIAQLEAAAVEARSLLGQLQSVLTFETGVPGDLANSAQAALTAVLRAFEQAERSLVAIENLADSDTPLQYQLQESLRELEGAARAIRILAEHLELYPETLLRGKSAREDP